MDTDGVNYTLKDTEHLTGSAGTQVSPTVKTYEGFESPNIQTATLASDGSTVVEYKYARKMHSYILNQADGADLSGSTPSGTRYYGEEISLKCVPAAGYQFVQWSNGDTSPITTFTMPNEDVTVVPTVEKASYTITYNLDGGTATNPEYYSSDTEAFTLNIPTKEGYIFSGWTGANGSTPQVTVTVNKGTSGNLTFTANWTAAGGITPAPESTDTTVNPNGLTNVQTGDTQKPLLYACIGAAAAAAILAIVFISKKRKSVK